MTYRELQAYLNHNLSAVYVDERERRNIIFLLLSHHSGLDRSRLMLQDEAQVPDVMIRKVNDSLIKLKENKPLQYIIGETWFHDLRILVNPAVLIPRPETEEMVEWSRQLPLKHGGKILEIGTGSGCIALALKKLLPDMHVTATDISEKALKTAIKNADLNNLEVTFMQWDIRNKHPLETETFDLIISNPPYIPPEEKHLTDSRVSDHEPNEALFTPDGDSLYYYRIIAGKARYMLNSRGWLVFECHMDFASGVASFLKQNSWMDVELKQDLSGKNRYVFATLR